MAYVRNAWYVAAWSCDLSPATPFAISILGDPIVIWRSDDGVLSALEDRCVHRFAPLSLGRCEGRRLRCMYHGLLYEPSGQVVEIPGQDLIPGHARVRHFPVVDRHDWIWIWMGNPALADDSLIPQAVGISDPNWILGHGNIDYQAEARLVCDNLLDFSHLSYVHAKSFGAGPEFAQRQPTITLLDRGVRVSRWMTSPVGDRRNPHDVPVEAYQSYDFLVPGILLMWSANFSEGTSARLGSLAPAMEDALSGLNFTSQAVTATGPKTARYFFSWGPHCQHGDAPQRDMMMAMAETAFAEDRVMIEAQQRVIDTAPDRGIMPTAHDKGVTLYNRLVERLANAVSHEQGAAA
jgi:phenylpropionate dioxygenase-like ring-hydroxylating dioxygenase large terminal subunit